MKELRQAQESLPRHVNSQPGSFLPQERDQTEGPCPVPYYLYLVKYKNGLSRFNHKLQPGPKTFPNQGIIKRTPITLVWDVICQTEGSQPHCVNNNELISLERIKY